LCPAEYLLRLSFCHSGSLLLPSALHNPCYFLLSCRVPITCFCHVESLLLLLSFIVSVVCLCPTEALLLLPCRVSVTSVLQSPCCFFLSNTIPVTSVLQNSCYLVLFWYFLLSCRVFITCLCPAESLLFQRVLLLIFTHVYLYKSSISTITFCHIALKSVSLNPKTYELYTSWLLRKLVTVIRTKLTTNYREYSHW